MHMVVLQTRSSAAFCSSPLFIRTDCRFDNHGDGELVSGSFLLILFPFLRIVVFPRNRIELMRFLGKTTIRRNQGNKLKIPFITPYILSVVISFVSLFVIRDSFPEKGVKCNLIGSMLVSAGSTGLQGKQR